MKEQDCCTHAFAVVGKEFKKENLLLKHVPIDDFFKSQWQRGTTSIWFLLYRWFVALFFTATVLANLIVQFNAGKFFIYLTDWGFILCMVTSVYGAVLVTLWHFNPLKYIVQTAAMKAYWALHVTTITLAIVITFVYWTFLYPLEETDMIGVFNFFAHGCNSILMVIDQLVVAFPTRLLHIVYPASVGLVFAVFSIIYYLAGGLDPFGNRFIYPILDWSTPGLAVATTVGVFVLLVVFIFLVYGLYKLRHFIYKKINNAVVELPGF